MGLYKLLATPEELAALSMQHVDHTTKGESINAPVKVEFDNGRYYDECGNEIKST